MNQTPARAITTLQAAMLVIITLGIPIHVDVVGELLKTAGRDAWLSLLLFAPAGAAVWTLVIRAARFSRSQIVLDRMNDSGQAAFTLLVDLFAVLALAQSLSLWQAFASIVVLPGAPAWLLSAILLLASAWIARHGLPAIAVTVGVLLPVVMALGLLNSLSTVGDKDYGVLLPVLEHGAGPLWNSLWTPLPIAGEFVILLFLAPDLQNGLAKTGPWWIVFSILFVIALDLTVAILSEYGPYEASHLTFPAFGGWRLMTWGPYFDRMDYFAVYQWTAGLAGRIMVLLYVCGRALRSAGARRINLVAVACAVLALVCIPLDMPVRTVWRETGYRLETGLELAVILCLVVLAWVRARRRPAPGSAAHG